MAENKELRARVQQLEQLIREKAKSSRPDISATVFSFRSRAYKMMIFFTREQALSHVHARSLPQFFSPRVCREHWVEASPPLPLPPQSCPNCNACPPAATNPAPPPTLGPTNHGNPTIKTTCATFLAVVNFIPSAPFAPADAMNMMAVLLPRHSINNVRTHGFVCAHHGWVRD